MGWLLQQQLKMVYWATNYLNPFWWAAPTKQKVDFLAKPTQSSQFWQIPWVNAPSPIQDIISQAQQSPQLQQSFTQAFAPKPQQPSTQSVMQQPEQPSPKQIEVFKDLVSKWVEPERAKNIASKVNAQSKPSIVDYVMSWLDKSKAQWDIQTVKQWAAWLAAGVAESITDPFVFWANLASRWSAAIENKLQDITGAWWPRATWGQIWDVWEWIAQVSNVNPESELFKAGETVGTLAAAAIPVESSLVAGSRAIKLAKVAKVEEASKFISKIADKTVEEIYKNPTVKTIWEAISPYTTKGKTLGKIQTTGRWVEWVGKIGKLKEKVLIPSKEWKQMIKTANEIGIKSDDAVANLEIAENAIETEAKALKDQIINKWNFAFNPSEISSKLRKIKKPRGLQVGDDTFEGIIEEADEIVKWLDKKNWVSLLDARIEFDRMINNKYPNVWTDPAKSQLRDTVSQVRNVFNDVIKQRAKWIDVAGSLEKQSNIFKISDNLKTRPSDVWGNAITEFLNKNPLIRKSAQYAIPWIIGVWIWGKVFGE